MSKIKEKTQLVAEIGWNFVGNLSFIAKIFLKINFIDLEYK